MKKINYKSVLFMVIITVIFTGALATINELTKSRVLLNQELKEQKALLYVLDLPTPKSNAIEVNAMFRSSFKEVNKGSLSYYEAYKDGLLVGYVFPFEGDAVWGHLRGFIGLTTDLQNVLGVYFLSHSETPGLGGRIDEMQYKEQFRGISIKGNESNYIIYRPNPDGQVDSITGATGTSNAVRRILNANLDHILKIMKEGQ